MRTIVWILIALTVLPLQAKSDVKIGGFAAVETRAFLEKPQHTRQRHGHGPGLILEPEFYSQSADTKTSFSFRPFLHLDPHDSRRTHGDIRQCDLLLVRGDYEVGIGASKVFWGVVESYHLVDILNQSDAVESSLDLEEKLGQPMIRFSVLKPWGTLRFFYMPMFRERIFVGKKGRLRGPFTVDPGLTTYDHPAGKYHQDFAVRLEKVIGDWDINLSYFRGTSREPILTLNSTQQRMASHYKVIDQGSLEVQYTRDAWLWKGEFFARSGHGRAILAGIGGFEYTLYQIRGTDWDLGLLTEYHRDNRSSMAPGVSMEEFVFVGTRFSANDTDDTEILLGCVFNTKRASQSFSVEAKKRLDDRLKLEIEGRLFGEANGASAGTKKDSHIQAKLAYYF